MTERIQPGHDYFIRVQSRQLCVRVIEFACELGLWRCTEARTGKLVLVPRAAFSARRTTSEPSCRRAEWNDSRSRPDSHVAV